MRPKAQTLIAIVLFTCGAACLPFLPDIATTLWLALLALWIAVLIVDAVRLQRLSEFELTRTIDSNLPVSALSRVTLNIKSHNTTQVQLEAFDHAPRGFEVSGQPASATLKRGEFVKMKYRVKPLQRGDAEFSGVDLLVNSPWNFWRRKTHHPLSDAVKVYPNFAGITQYSLLATDNHLSQVGIRDVQRRGEGSDFHQLREYRDGDSFRQIDWKATARRQKLISREFRDERDQQIVFLIDCGRRMRHMESGQAHLDHALNAMLLLSYVASSQGDSVGFLAFAGQDKWVVPKKGANTVTYLLDQCYDLASTSQAADYLTTARKILELQKRRALIVILSNSRAEDQQDLTHAVKMMSRRHVVVFADLLEEALPETLTSDIDTLDDAMTWHGVTAFLEERAKAHEKLNRVGAICLDTTAKQLTAKLVNTYLQIKRSAKL